MICYMDKTFCSETACGNTECHRHLGQSDIDNAERIGLFIAQGNFKTERCGFELAKEGESK